MTQSQIHELFDELDAWNPRWREQCRSIYEAARASGAGELYRLWAQTEDGRNYERLMFGVPNYQSAIEAQQEAANRLPTGIATHKDS